MSTVQRDDRRLGTRPRRPSLDDKILLGAALQITEAEGLAGLTLRPLAAQMGVTVSVLNGRYGDRAAIVAAILAAALADDQAFLDPWRARLAALDGQASSARADFLELLFDALTGPRRRQTILFLECLQATVWDPALVAPFSRWLDDWGLFLSILGRQSGLSEDILRTGLLTGYLLDELAFSLALGSSTSYRSLRKLCLHGLAQGFRHPQTWSVVQAQFGFEFEALDRDEAIGARHPIVQPSKAWQARAMACAASLLTHQGVGAVTHRSVAALAELRPTTLAYRYPRQEDLVLGGLDHIICRLVGRVSAGDVSLDAMVGQPDGPGFEIGRATFAVALFAARHPALRACAADMRRRRGVNFLRVLEAHGLEAPWINPLSAQVMSIAVKGLLMTKSADPSAILETTRSALDALRDWTREQTASNKSSPNIA